MKILPAIVVASCIALIGVEELARSQITAIDPAAEARFNRAAADHKRELNDLRTLRGESPLALSDATADSIAEVLAARLPEDAIPPEAVYPDRTAVLFYDWTAGELRSWLVTVGGIQAYNSQTIEAEDLRQRIAQLRWALAVGKLQQARLPRRIDSASNQRSLVAVGKEPRLPRVPLKRAIAELTELLLPKKMADDLQSVEHLIVVPVGELGMVPYAMLQPFADGAPLVERMSVSIAPSLFDLGVPIAPWESEWAFSEPLLVGNPKFPSGNEWEFPPLPGAEAEVNAVATQLEARPLLGAEATKTVAIAQASRARFLYFATHGLSDPRNPLSGGFLLFAASRLSEARWSAREIQSTRLQAELAVLSACQTGLGQAHDAGTIGLARAFQIAGVPRVVMSLWNVDDQATNQLMQAFVRYLEEAVPAEALRLAMLEMKQDRPNPVEWASFMLFGTPR